MALLDLLGRRTALRVLWELRGDALTFRALLAAAGTNPGVLNARLAELRESGIVALTANGYALTTAGRRLLDMLQPLSRWAEDWAEALGRPNRKRRSGGRV
jgi:DNA-binding HxlR family transcriptional regulator